MPSTRVGIENRVGRRLAARLDLPEAPPRAFALFAHCFTCSKDSLAASRVARGLMDRGVGVLRIDFTGLGESEGDFDATGFGSNLADIEDAAAWLRAEHAPPAILIGHSLGGAAALAVAPGVDGVRAVATIGAPADPAHVRHLFADQVDTIEAEGSAEVSLGGRPFRIGKVFLDDLAAQNPELAVRSLGLPLMIFHAPADRIVGIENAARIYEWARHPKSFISLDRADHLLTDRRDADFVAAMISAWSERVLQR